MNSPLKQYRQYLLIPAILCISSLLLFSVIKVSNGRHAPHYEAAAYAAEGALNSQNLADYRATSVAAVRIERNADAVPKVVSSTKSNALSIEAQSSITNQSALSDESLTHSRGTDNPVLLSVSGANHTLLNQPTIAVASVEPTTGTSTSAVYPVAYNWAPDPLDPVTVSFRSNGVTSTATITYTTVGLKVIDVMASTSVGEVTEPFTIAVSARSVSISSFQTTTFRYLEFNGSGIRVDVPGQSIVGQIQLDYLPIPGVNASGETGFTGKAFELRAYQNQRFLSSYSFAEPVEVTLTYGINELGGHGQSLLRMRRWQSDGQGSGQWVDVAEECGTSSSVDFSPERRQVSTQACLLGQFALFGAAASLYLPLIQ